MGNGPQGTDGARRGDAASQFAVSQVLGPLSPGTLEAFRREQAEAPIYRQAELTQFDCEMRDGLPRPLKQSDRQEQLWQEIAAALEHQGRHGGGVVLKAHLVLVIEPDEDRPARILTVPDEAIIRYLRPLIHHGRMTAAELRLLKQLICGADLAEAARADGVAHETKRSQFKSLARKLDARSQGELTSRALAHLLMGSMGKPTGGGQGTDNLFIALADEFMPGARCHKLQGTGRTRHRFIDLGPLDGRPVIFVHPQILPDFRPEDMDALSVSGLRLIVPLRNGAMAQGCPTLNVSDHLDHACEGIDIARRHFVGDRADLLLCISGAAYGIEYARRRPQAIASLAFVGAPASGASSSAAAARLRNGLLRLATSDGALFSRMMDFLGRRITHPGTFRKLLANYYRPCPADLQIVDAEYAAPHGGERVRKQITASLSSIKHDLHHQVRPRWHDLPMGSFPIMFFHGEKDFFYPIEAVRALCDEFGGLPVHAIPDAGQLLYYRHFAPLMEAYQRFVMKVGN